MHASWPKAFQASAQVGVSLQHFLLNYKTHDTLEVRVFIKSIITVTNWFRNTHLSATVRESSLIRHEKRDLPLNCTDALDV